MTLEEILAVLDSTGFPVAYRAFPKGKAPETRYICYLTPGSSNFFADDSVYWKISQIRVELYTNQKDPEAEQIVENALASASIPWEATEVYIESENMYQITYEIEV